MDWCKYNDCVIATGSVDRTIKVWDVRVPDREVSVLSGHAYAVRRQVVGSISCFQLSACTLFSALQAGCLGCWTSERNVS